MKAAQNDVSLSSSSWKEPKESLELLTLPMIEVARGRDHRDLWKDQSYADFAQKLQRKNPGTLLTKHIVDAAFNLATIRMSTGGNRIPGRDSAIARVRDNALNDIVVGFANHLVQCLGKESAKYWKDR
jgi:hypothetical protein